MTTSPESREIARKALLALAERGAAVQAAKLVPVADNGRHVRDAFYSRHPMHFLAQIGLGWTAWLLVGGALWTTARFENVSLGARLVLEMVWLVGSYLFAHSLARWVVRRAVEHERAWLSRVGFELVGYFECLGEAPHARRVRTIVTLMEEAPAAAVLAGLFATAEATLVEHDLRRLVVQSPSIDAPHNEYGVVLDNSDVLRWQRRLVGSVLVPLHAAHPISRVVFE